MVQSVFVSLRVYWKHQYGQWAKKQVDSFKCMTVIFSGVYICYFISGFVWQGKSYNLNK